MSSALRSPTTAHVAPLAVFLGLGSLVPLVAVENTVLPWWRHAPEQWVYPLQTLLVGALLWWWRTHYALKPVRGLALAAFLGAFGILWWCLPALLWQKLTAAGIAIPEWGEWLGLAERKEGFDPTLFDSQPLAYGVVLLLRFIRMVVVVPFIEEIFWRGFLMRFVQADGGDFQRVPFGRHTWPAFALTTLGFMLVHDKTDWLGALGFGSLMYLLAIRTKSLAACILMHAVANLMLGGYVVATRQWGFW